MRSIFILTGAGVSAESGIDTFRDADGIWSKVRLEDVATPEGFARDPQLVLDFYNSRRAKLDGVHPNPAHDALVRLERACAASGRTFTLVTQNVDDLHERAGSSDVIHMHGEMRKMHCGACGRVAPYVDAIARETPCPGCGQTGAMRPNVVWFGEMPYHMDRIYAALAAADLFVALGTSGAVYPAAALVQQARAGGIRTVELNLEPSGNALAFDEAHYGPASVVTPAFVDRLTGESKW